ncbi:MAG: 3'-5' exonuclease [Bacteroidia bacterium]
MSLDLKKSIVFFDIEATGLNVSKDRIVEISFLKLEPNIEDYECRSYRINPEMPIPADSTKIHGITDEDVKDKPTFKQVAKEINQYFGNSDLSGFNVLRFDLPMLVEEFLRAGMDFQFSDRKVIDVQKIFHTMEKRTLTAAYQFYCGKELEQAHTSEADTRATYEVLCAQLERYKELQNNVDHLYNFLGSPGKTMVDLAGRLVRNKQGVEVFNFGKHNGRPVEEVFRKEPSYYNWMMERDFPQHTKQKITEIRLRMKNS